MNFHSDIPFETEPIESMRQRWNKAVGPVFDLNSEKSMSTLNPRDHVFDFSNGMRIAVTRSVILNDPIMHFSCSIRTGSLIHYNLIEIDKPIERMIQGTLYALTELAKIPQTIEQAIIRSHDLLYIYACPVDAYNCVEQVAMKDGRFFWSDGKQKFSRLI